jgi:hypothetical protein
MHNRTPLNALTYSKDARSRVNCDLDREALGAGERCSAMEELETAERLVREWAIYVDRAEALLADLERARHDQAAAIVRRCLLTFSATLDFHRGRLSGLRAASCQAHEHDEQNDQREPGGGIDHP